MKLNLVKELAALEQMTVGQLQQRYADVFGEIGITVVRLPLYRFTVENGDTAIPASHRRGEARALGRRPGLPLCPGCQR